MSNLFPPDFLYGELIFNQVLPWMFSIISAMKEFSPAKRRHLSQRALSSWPEKDGSSPVSSLSFPPLSLQMSDPRFSPFSPVRAPPFKSHIHLLRKISAVRTSCRYSPFLTPFLLRDTSSPMSALCARLAPHYGFSVVTLLLVFTFSRSFTKDIFLAPPHSMGGGGERTLKR